MKKRFFFGLLMTFLSSVGFAQVNFTIQGGTNLTGITQSKDYNARFGYRVGVGVEFPVNKTWALQTGLQFLNRSYSFDQSFAFGIGMNQNEAITCVLGMDSKINAISLQLPLKVSAFVPLNKDCGLQFSAGPYVAYGIGGKSNWNWDIEYIYPLEDNGFHDGNYVAKSGGGKQDTFGNGAVEGLKRWDVGICAGVDFKYKFLFAGFGAEYGFMPIHTEMPKVMTDYVLGVDHTVVSPHNIGLEIHVGFCFSLNPKR